MFRARGGSTGVNGAGTRRARRFASLLLLVGLLWLGSRASTADNLRRSSEGEYASQIYRGVAEGARAFIHHDAHRARDRGPYERPSILLLGDSLVQRGYEPGGWVSRLANEYARTADVVLRGYAGYNTRWIRQLMTDRPGLFPDPKHVALVIVLLVRSHPSPRAFASSRPVPRARVSESSRIHSSRLAPLTRPSRAPLSAPQGANDAARPEGHKSHYAVPAAEYEANLRWIVERYSIGPDGAAVVLCTPPPVDEDERRRRTVDVKGMPASLLDRSSRHTASYAMVAREVGRTSGVPVADLHAAFAESGRDWEGRLLSDGLHFAAEGHELAFDVVSRAVPERARSAALGYDARAHEEVVGANNTDDWHGHLAEMGVA